MLFWKINWLVWPYLMRLFSKYYLFHLVKFIKTIFLRSLWTQVSKIVVKKIFIKKKKLV